MKCQADKVRTLGQLSKLFGKTIKWHTRKGGQGLHTMRRGRLTGILGKNAVVDGQYHWFPKMFDIRVVEDVTDEPQ